jgi:hypothetical protein
MVLGIASRKPDGCATGSPLALVMTFSDVSLSDNAVCASIGEMQHPIPTPPPLCMYRQTRRGDNQLVPSSRLRSSPALFAIPNRSPSPLIINPT